MPRYPIHDTHKAILDRLKMRGAIGLGDLSCVYGCWLQTPPVIIRTNDELGHFMARYDRERDTYRLTMGRPGRAYWKRKLDPSNIQRATDIIQLDGSLVLVVGDRAIRIHNAIRDTVAAYVQPSRWSVGELRLQKDSPLTGVPVGLAYRGDDLYAIAAPLARPGGAQDGLTAASFWQDAPNA